MSAQGYWVECITVRSGSLFSATPSLYAAQISEYPDLKSWGISPDRAISKLKRRLEILNAEARPKGHSRLSPPKRLRAPGGWLSVYLDLQDHTAQK